MVAGTTTSRPMTRYSKIRVGRLIAMKGDHRLGTIPKSHRSILAAITDSVTMPGQVMHPETPRREANASTSFN